MTLNEIKDTLQAEVLTCKCDTNIHIEKKIPLLATNISMFETCGRLYEKGLMLFLVLRSHHLRKFISLVFSVILMMR